MENKELHELFLEVVNRRLLKEEKHGDTLYLMTLKADSLARLNKRDEALSICHMTIEQMMSTDNVNVDVLDRWYKVLGRLGRLDLAGMYEYACRISQPTLKLLTSLFIRYVRESSFVKQEQTALEMYRQSNGEVTFLLWAVGSIQLQVFVSNWSSNLLSSAENLLSKHIAAHGLQIREGVVRLYISVMEEHAKKLKGKAKKDKYTATLAISSGVLGRRLPTVDRLRTEGRLLACSGDYTRAREVFKKLLEARPDWDCFLHYLSCLLEDDSIWCAGTTHNQIQPPKLVHRKFCPEGKDPTEVNELFDSLMRTALQVVEKLKLTTEKHDNIELYDLASLELERRYIIQGLQDGSRLIELLDVFFSRYGHLPCFATTVKVFVAVLTNDQKLKLGTLFSKRCKKSSKGYGQMTTYSKLLAVGLVFELSLVGLEEMVVSMTYMYIENLHSRSIHLNFQDIMHEEGLSIVCNVLIQLFWKTSHLGYLLEAIFVLEFGLTVQRDTSQYKIFLVHLYSHLGAFQLAYEWYKKLEIEDILLETYSHHILPMMLKSPFMVESTNLLEEYLRLKKDSFIECAKRTLLGFSSCNFPEIIELGQLKKRLEHSGTYLMAQLDTPILQLKRKANKIQDVEAVLERWNSGIQPLQLEESWETFTWEENMMKRPWWTPFICLNYLHKSPCNTFSPLVGDENREMCAYHNNGSGGGGGGGERMSAHQERKLEKVIANVRRGIKRRSFTPRLVHLSIGTATYPEDGEMTELRSFLCLYAKSLGCSFAEAVQILLKMAKDPQAFQQKVSNSLEGKNKQKLPRSGDIVDWLSFAVFLNAWKLGAEESLSLDEDDSKADLWDMVDMLMANFNNANISLGIPLLRYPGFFVSDLVQMVTEPLAWHLIVIEACIRSLSTSRHGIGLRQQIKRSILSCRAILANIIEMLRDRINVEEDDYVAAILSLSHGEEGVPAPGEVYQLLCNPKLKWDAVEVERKILRSQDSTLNEFRRIIEQKLSFLQSLEKQLK